MLPHCDTLDGPVVTAAREALEEEQLNQVLPFVSDSGEDEVREAFAKVLEALGQLAGGTRLGGVGRITLSRCWKRL